ncbi:HD-GYP domain, c-di-GMP phosphodiesterase class II (or its inactivated variant) [Marinitoga hydrogenitolerans DSM 16785]|uniref:HD-GYP domain, c-di-GMP phosphodiesterase class II (Or its inactivated variant) n=1 Tax=Marinitoga hydrogenitolerans (strain DSM 16785 / JCM 12826 / AT1271) TaxID=1122195 RepID=A0A1M4ZRG2_MARH1|nr:HD-GYP domain-containing protein [Marinitoga hydrogenitolerans]SHF20670.1 HD-GYP domain, c-di-GMP phosphodiesterase class II (or its inactivated variant) [Marinitoga hydrogenitolerans DSM 16785]
MKNEQITLYKLLTKNIMMIVVTAITFVLILVSIFSFINITKVEKSLKNNIEELIKLSFNSFYNTMYDFDSRYYKGLDILIEDIKKNTQKADILIDEYIATHNTLKKDNVTIIKDNTLLDNKIREKLTQLEPFNYFIELELNSDKLIRNIYIKTDKQIYMFKTLLSTDKIQHTINTLSELKEKYEFITEINICTHHFEGLSPNFSALTKEDEEYLVQAFSTEKDIVIKKGEKINFYFIWKYEDSKTYFHPLGIVLKLDFSMYRNSMIFNIILFIILLIFIMLFISKKAHNVSKQISKPFEIMLDNMKKFQETRYLEFDKIMEKCDIKEINELMNEYQKMTEDIMSSFEEINAMNEELETSYNEIEKINNELEEAYLNFSTQLSIIAEGFDENTGNHVHRVGELSAFIAQKLDLKDEIVQKIRHYAPLHDMGKIMIPKEILNKKGRLTEEEFEIIRKHTLYGGLIIGDSPKFEIAKNIALYHHEKYNGKGYPHGLKGDDIPLCAAIVSVVDVYDALRSERPYKPAFTHEKTMNIILKGDDRTNPDDFNPKILKILKEYEHEIKELWENINQNSSKLLDVLKEIDKK